MKFWSLSTNVGPWTPRLWIMLLVINAAFVGFSAHNLLESRQRYDERTKVDTRNMTAALAEAIKSRLDTIDGTLRSLSRDPWVRDVLLRAPDPQRRAVLEAAHERHPEVRGFHYFDALGRLAAYSGDPGDTPSDLSRVASLEAVREQRTGQLLVSAPFQAPTSGEWCIGLAYRLEDAGAEFQGIVSTSLPLELFQTIFSALDLGAFGAVGLRGLDNALIVRLPRALPQTGVPTPRTAPAEAAFRRNAMRGTYVSRAQLDGITRTVSYQRIASYPFYVYLALASQDDLAPWYVERNRSYLTMVGFLMVTSLLMWFVASGMRKHERISGDLLGQEQKLRVLLESASDALLVLDADNVVQSSNRAAEELLQVPPGSLPGVSLDYLLARRQRKAYATIFDKLLQGQGVTDRSTRREFLLRRRNGSTVPVAALVQRVEGAKGALLVLDLRDVTEQRAAQQRMRFLAQHDALTGLPNRRMADQLLLAAVQRAERRGLSVAVIQIGLDHFKAINDAEGHAVGDRYLQMVAKRLTDRNPSAGDVCRLSGDEFLLVTAMDPEARQFNGALEQLLDDLRAPVDVDGMAISTTSSAGVALYPQDGKGAEILMRRASLAMNHAKVLGRDRFCYFNTATEILVQDRNLLLLHLRRAKWDEELALHYQPIIALESGKMVSVEALLRWAPPALGTVSPDRFIPVAEESGLIVDIGEWVLGEACRQSRLWEAAGRRLPIAVNLSAIQFQRGGSEDVEVVIWRALQEYGLPSQALHLELTESVLLQNTEKVLNSLQRLKERGLEISIDDFGTGYSSLSYLRRLDAHKVKIDQSFIRNLNRAPADMAIVRAIIQMAHSLGLTVVAEGVETVEIWRILCELDCDFGQGYLFSRPIPGDKLDLHLQLNSDQFSLNPSVFGTLGLQ